MTRKSKKAVVVRPDPTPSEVEAMALAKERNAARPARLQIASDRSDPARVIMGPDHCDDAGFAAWVRDVFGTRSNDFAGDQMSKIARVSDGLGFKSDRMANAQLAMIAGIGPRNELESALAAQLVAAHDLGMGMMAKAANAPDVGIAERYVTMATKLQRTFAGSVEALSRLRGGGKQTVEVKHVYVNGNAVVGDGNQALFGPDPGGGVGYQNGAQSRESGSEASTIASLSGQDAARDALLLTGHEGPQALPVARGIEPGCTKGGA
jgi:hypothetical protein